MKHPFQRASEGEITLLSERMGDKRITLSTNRQKNNIFLPFLRKQIVTLYVNMLTLIYFLP